MRTASSAIRVAFCSAVLTLSWPGGLATAAAVAPAAEQYQCPMHPSYTLDHKGDCPVCGMRLVPARPEPAPRAAAAPAGAAMRVSPEKQRVLGMVVAPAQRSAGARTLRVLGRVAVDEARLYKLNAGMAGSVRDVSPVATGGRVKKGQVLGWFYAPDAISIMQLFIVNAQGYDRLQLGRLKQDGTPAGEGHGEEDVPGIRRGAGVYQANLQQRIMQLENLGVPELQRDEMARTGLIPDAVMLVSPADGFVLARNAFPGLKFDRGFELYRIADLRRVWVIADVFPQDAPHLRPGMRAEVSVPGRSVTLPGRVTEILPQFDTATRTLKVKLVVDNPEHLLRPDMFVDVAVKADFPPGVVVPSDAIVDSGLVKRVFVQSGEGIFEPRVVEIGWRSGGQAEVVKGLRPGELVVASGTFFLDSETRMRPPASGAAAADGGMPAPSGHRPPGGAGVPGEARAGAAPGEAVRRGGVDGR